MSTPMKMYPQNDQDVTIAGLTDNTGALVTGATVTITLVDNVTKTPQIGCINLACADLAGIPGSYIGTVEETFVSPPGAYTLQITAAKAGLNLYREKPVTVLIPTV